MKHYTIALLTAAAALAANSLRAETRFSFGVHLGVPAHRPVAPIVVHAPAPMFVPAPPPPVIYAPTHGYWNEVVVKTWVPERWVFTRDRWGRSVRVCEPGYFTHRTDRVWVESRRGGYPTGRPGNYAHGHWGR